MILQIDKDEKELIYIGLCIRRNIIETGDPYYSAQDIKNRIDTGTKPEDIGVTIRALSEDQMKTILKSKELERKVLSVQ